MQTFDLFCASVLALAALTISASAEPACGLYQYRAEITEVYDGDTVTADIDLGFHTWRRDEKLRLFGIDAPEVRGGNDEEKRRGLAARDALSNWILGKTLIICTIKDRKGKYGRYLVDIYLDGERINDRLVREGYAIPAEY